MLSPYASSLHFSQGDPYFAETFFLPCEKSFSDGIWKPYNTDVETLVINILDPNGSVTPLNLGCSSYSLVLEPDASISQMDEMFTAMKEEAKEYEKVIINCKRKWLLDVMAYLGDLNLEITVDNGAHIEKPHN